MSQHAFDFDYLYYQYMPTLANDSQFLTNPYSNTSIITLTYEGCKVAVGTGTAWNNRQDVYDRVLLWRIPLIALWATTTLPALGQHTKIFTLLHLVADPIDTFWSLFYKLDLAKRNARWARDTDKDEKLCPGFTFPDNNKASNGNIEGNPLVRTQTAIGDRAQRDRELKKKLEVRDEDILRYYRDVVALIIATYDEWDLGIPASKAINYGFNRARWTPTQLADLRNRCASAAFYIASDRVSRFLPSAVSTLVFLAQITAGFWKTLNALGDTYEDTNPVSKGLNRAPHNIAFGALFFWLPLAVLMTAFVGGSQTSHLVPRVLGRFRCGVQQSRLGQDVQAPPDPTFEIADFPDLDNISDKRWARGGLPVWQTAKFKKVHKRAAQAEGQQNDIQEKRPSRIYCLLISITIVAIPTGCAMAVSWLTPTEGLGCRAVTQLGFFGSWILSVVMDWAIFALFSGNEGDDSTQESPRLMSRKIKGPEIIFWLTFAKDFMLTCGTIILLTFTALGVFNNCNCWCKWTLGSLVSSKARYLSFPQQPYIFSTITYQLRHTFPIIVGFALLSQIILFVVIAIYFNEGYRVLKQRDIDAALKGPNFFCRTWRTWRRRFPPDPLLNRKNADVEANAHRLDPILPDENRLKTPLLSEAAGE